MTQERTERQLNPDIIGKLSETLQLPDDDKRRFDALLAAWRTDASEYFTALRLRDSRVALVREGLVASQQLFDSAQDQFSQAQASVARGDDEYVAGRFPTILGRIRIKMGRVPSLPWYLKPFKGFITSEHPYLASYREELAKSRQALQDAEKAVGIQVTEILADPEPVVGKAEAKLARSERSLVAFGDSWAASSLEMAKDYIGLFQGLPQYKRRLEVVSSNCADRWANEYAGSRQFLEFLDEKLLVHVPKEQRDSVRVRWYAKSIPWYASYEIPTQENFEELPEEIRREWKSRIRQEILEELQM